MHRMSSAAGDHDPGSRSESWRGQMSSSASGREETGQADPARIVIAGGGLAGLRTIEELRGLGYPGAITLIGAERRPPYDRPPLSKQLMMGDDDDTSLRAELDS